MKKYRNTETGIIWNKPELREDFEHLKWESEYLGSFENFSDYLDDQIEKGILKKIEIKSGKCIKFEYDGIEFEISVIDNYCKCYAESRYQFGFELGQDGFTETMDDLTEMLINNYENGNIFIED